MLSEIVKLVIGKSIARDVVKMAVKNGDRDNNVVKEKLGVSSIDDFMKMNYQDFQSKRKETLS